MNLIEISIRPELKSKNPNMALGTIQCQVTNSLYHPELWEEIQRVSEQIRQTYSFESIKDQPQIAATRTMYQACGKEPSRYRPSSEALMRRIVKGMELYQINTLVDLVNLVSLKSGYSIGGFDASYIRGKVEAGIGREGEPYTGIGRGPINIHNLPVLRDELGGIGTPTSDEERTAIRPGTSMFLMNINGYTGADDLAETMDYAEMLLQKFVNASEIIRRVIE